MKREASLYAPCSRVEAWHQDLVTENRGIEVLQTVWVFLTKNMVKGKVRVTLVEYVDIALCYWSSLLILDHRFIILTTSVPVSVGILATI
jgi:hypothetical protein